MSDNPTTPTKREEALEEAFKAGFLKSGPLENGYMLATTQTAKDHLDKMAREYVALTQPQQPVLAGALEDEIRGTGNFKFPFDRPLTRPFIDWWNLTQKIISQRSALRSLNEWLDFYKKKNAALAQPQEPVDLWQDMETCPKDESEVLGLFLGNRLIMAWSDSYKGWIGKDVKWVDGGQTFQKLVDGWGNGGPDGWQPLPPAPTSEKDDTK